MSGLVKAKKYDWKDSNLALFGSDTEKQVKKESAESEPMWQGVGQEAGLKIFRIVKFQVEEWPEEDYGEFYNGDSYIILNTYQEPENEELHYDVHFWIGQYSTQDEYGTAAYKTVELDTFLDDKAVQHREVQGHESELFKSYFKTITKLQGGSDSGFRKVEPETYTPRLLRFNGKSNQVVVEEVPLARSRVTSDDVFILDLGLELYQWNGSNCNKDEKFMAAQYMQQIESKRGGRPNTEVLEEADISESHKFYESLTADDEDDDDIADEPGMEGLYKLSDESGSMEMNLVKESEVSKDDLSSEDVFMFDTGSELFVWIGSGASEAEKKNGLAYAHMHLTKTAHPLIPVSVVREGQHSAAFETAMAA